jgi:hypothetical protein
VAYQHEHVIRAQYEQLAAERAEVLAQYESARINEDGSSTMFAADRLLEVDQKRAALDRIANNYVASQQQPQGNQFGLNQDELDIANGIAGGDQTITNEQRQRAYAQNKERLRYLRQTGQYRDDQGTTR